MLVNLDSHFSGQFYEILIQGYDMYNLFVDSDKNNWDGNPTWLPIDRFLTYTDSELKSGIDLSKPETLKKLKSLPCVFSYESQAKKDAVVGWIDEIRVKDKKLHYSYTLEPNVEPIPWDFFEKNQWDMDIDDWEMNTTHWALKKIDLLKVLIEKKFVDEDFKFSRKAEEVYFTKPILAVIKPALAEFYSHKELDDLFSAYGFKLDTNITIINKNARVSSYLDHVEWADSQATIALAELLTQVHNQNGHLIKMGQEGQTSNPIYHMALLDSTLEKNGIKWNGKSYEIPDKKSEKTTVLSSLSLKKLTNIPSAFSEYRAINVIGEGGSGRVFKVENLKGEQFALKILSPERINSEKISRFRNEIFFSLKNNHLNIIKVHDIGFLMVGDKKCPFYIMPLFQASFRNVLEQENNPKIKLKLFLGFIDGLMHAHSLQCWHRDIKPENILYDQEIGSLVLSDFGIAHLNEEYLVADVNTKEHAHLANFQYASPEQRITGGRVDSRSDIYSAGLILNEIFTGTIPWGAGHKNIAEVNSEFADLDSVVNLMIQHNPDNRKIDLKTVHEAITKKIM